MSQLIMIERTQFLLSHNISQQSLNVRAIMAGKKLTNMLACCFHDGENLIPGWSSQTQISFGAERLDLSVKTEDNSRVKMPLTGDWRETILIISKTYSEL